jgi:hypothetical protein
MNDVRRAAVAGSWYPDAPDRLAQQVDGFVAAAAGADVPAPIAIVAPHAGLRYSGPVAAFAYRTIQAGRYASIVLVGPSHFVGFDGVSIWPRGAWQTPFGDVAVDESLASALVAASRDVVEHRPAHAREHSLELQMPFIAHLCPGVPIVPLVMGYQRRETALALGDALARVINERPRHANAGAAVAEATADARVLLVASSDLSHHHDARVASSMDAVVLEQVERLDADALMQALEDEPQHACGGGPMVSVLRAARELGARHARVLKYGDSGDVNGDKSSVVGYMAAAIW